MVSLNKHSISAALPAPQSWGLQTPAWRCVLRGSVPAPGSGAGWRALRLCSGEEYLSAGPCVPEGWRDENLHRVSFVKTTKNAPSLSKLVVHVPGSWAWSPLAACSSCSWGGGPRRWWHSATRWRWVRGSLPGSSRTLWWRPWTCRRLVSRGPRDKNKNGQTLLNWFIKHFYI